MCLYNACRIDSTLTRPAAERTGGIDCKELQPSARGRLRAAGPDGPILPASITATTRLQTASRRNVTLGSQPAECPHEADLRDASSGPPPGGGCGPLQFHSEPQIQDSEFIISCHPPRPMASNCLDLARSRADGRHRLQGVAALRPGAAAGCGGSIRNRKFKIQNDKIGLQPAKRTHVRVRTAGLRRPQAAARRLLRNRICGPTPLS